MQNIGWLRGFFLLFFLLVFLGCSRGKIGLMDGPMGELRFAISSPQESGITRFATGGARLGFQLTSLTFGCLGTGARLAITSSSSDPKINVPVGTRGCDIADVILRGGPNESTYTCVGNFQTADVPHVCNATDGTMDHVQLALMANVPDPIGAGSAGIAFTVTPGRTTLGGKVVVSRPNPGVSILTLYASPDLEILLYDLGMDLAVDAATATTSGVLRLAYQSLSGTAVDVSSYQLAIQEPRGGLNVAGGLSTFSSKSISPWDTEVTIALPSMAAQYYAGITDLHALTVTLSRGASSSQYEVRLSPPPPDASGGGGSLQDLNPTIVEKSFLEETREILQTSLPPEDQVVIDGWLVMSTPNLSDEL